MPENFAAPQILNDSVIDKAEELKRGSRLENSWGRRGTLKPAVKIGQARIVSFEKCARSSLEPTIPIS
jgi:hypothetical protein